MPAIDATVGGAAANSYGTLQEAEDYFDTRLHDDSWYFADETTKVRALIWATRLLDVGQRITGTSTSGLYKRLTGEVATATQRLLWPRKGMRDRGERAIAENVVPREVKEAQFELAMRLIEGDRMTENQVSVLGLTRLRAGPVDLSFKNDIETQQGVPDAIWSMLVPSWYFPDREPAALVV